MTGAGISAESGIPTFRGEEGYWTVGSKVYQPSELATYAAFSRMPDDIWRWYLHRRDVCRQAEPNAAHHALVTLDRALGESFRLVTQNVDGLHLRAGSTPARTYQIHGNINLFRCSNGCSRGSWPLPDGDVDPQRILCPSCHTQGRPHVLWFDEYYDEPNFRLESTLAAARAATLVITIGTSASTNLPWRVVEIAVSNGATFIDVNAADNPFAEIARAADSGAAYTGAATEIVPDLVGEILAARDIES